MLDDFEIKYLIFEMENNNETPRVDTALLQSTVPPVTVNGTSNNIPQPLRFELSQLNSISLNS